MILWKSTIPGRRNERFTTRKWGASAWRKAKRLNPRVVAICSQGFIALLMACPCFGQTILEDVTWMAIRSKAEADTMAQIAPPLIVAAPKLNYFAVSAVRLDDVESAWSGIASSTNATVTLAWDYGDMSTLKGFNLYHGRYLDKMMKQSVGLTLTTHYPNIIILAHREFTVAANVGAQFSDPKSPAQFFTICCSSNLKDWSPIATTGAITIKVRSY